MHVVDALFVLFKLTNYLVPVYDACDTVPGRREGTVTLSRVDEESLHGVGVCELRQSRKRQRRVRWAQ